MKSGKLNPGINSLVQVLNNWQARKRRHRAARLCCLKKIPVVLSSVSLAAHGIGFSSACQEVNSTRRPCHPASLQGLAILVVSTESCGCMENVEEVIYRSPLPLERMPLYITKVPPSGPLPQWLTDSNGCALAHLKPGCRATSEWSHRSTDGVLMVSAL